MELDPAQPVLVGNVINFMKKLIITKARNLESTKFFTIRKDRAKRHQHIFQFLFFKLQFSAYSWNRQYQII